MTYPNQTALPIQQISNILDSHNAFDFPGEDEDDLISLTHLHMSRGNLEPLEFTYRSTNVRLYLKFTTRDDKVCIKEAKVVPHPNESSVDLVAVQNELNALNFI